MSFTISLSSIVSTSRVINQNCMIPLNTEGTRDTKKLYIEVGLNLIENCKRDLKSLNDTSTLAQRIEKQLNTQKVWFEIKAEQLGFTLTPIQ